MVSGSCRRCENLVKINKRYIYNNYTLYILHIPFFPLENPNSTNSLNRMYDMLIVGNNSQMTTSLAELIADRCSARHIITPLESFNV